MTDRYELAELLYSAEEKDLCCPYISYQGAVGLADYLLANGVDYKTAIIKEFAERFKRYIDVGRLRPPTEICFSELAVVNMIDIIASEMVGDKNV